LGHLHGKRKRVVGILEQAVGIDANGMKMDAGCIFRQTKRPLVANEVHFMAAPCKVDAHRRRKDSASPDRRVTRDANAEGAELIHVKTGSCCAPAAPASR